MTTVPFKANETLRYVNGWRPDAIDLSASPLTPSHLWNYLAFLKVDDRVINVSHQQLAAYLTTRDFVKCKGLTDIVKQVLYWHCYRELYQDGECEWSRHDVVAFVDDYRDVLNDVMRVLESLPVFLKTKAGMYIPNIAQMDNAAAVGVNFCHLFADDLFLMQLLPMAFAADLEFSTYYSDLFDAYIYGGDNLVWFVMSNPNNILFKAFVT